MLEVGSLVYYFDKDRKFQPGRITKLGRKTATIYRGEHCRREKIPLENLHEYGSEPPEPKPKKFSRKS